MGKLRRQGWKGREGGEAFAEAKLLGVGDLVGEELARFEDTNQNFNLSSWDDGVHQKERRKQALEGKLRSPCRNMSEDEASWGGGGTGLVTLGGQKRLETCLSEWDGPRRVAT